MGIWKHRHAPCGSPELEDLRPASTQSDAMSSVNSAISKPFNLMTIDELLEALPECNPAAVQEIWMPEMRKKFEATRAIVQNAEGRNFQSHESLVSMETDLKNINAQAQNVSALYEKVIKSAERLAEMNVDTLTQLLEEANDKVNITNAGCQKLRSELELKVKEVAAAQYNVQAVVDSIRDVLNKALQYPQNWDRVQCQNIQQVLQDYPHDPDQKGPSALRIRQQSFLQLVADLREAEGCVADLRALTQAQGRLVEEQSTEREKAMARQEESMQTIDTRDHEILLLDQRNREMEAKLEKYQVALRLADKDVAHNRSLQQQLHRVSQECDKRLEEKDAALLQMRQDFECVQEQLKTAQVDLRNANTTRALIAGQAGLNKPRPSLPSSYSSFTLNVRHLSEHTEAPRPQQTYKILGPHPKLVEPQQADVVVSQPPRDLRSLAQPVRSRHLSGPSEESITRPRRASLDSGKVIFARPHNETKPLPSPPTIVASISLGNRSHQTECSVPSVSPEMVPNISAPMHDQGHGHSPRYHMRDYHWDETPPSGKRMLSLIAEASHEGSSSPESNSATSSEKNAYRGSIHALELLNSQSSPAEDSPEEPVMHASWSEPHRRRGLRKVASAEMDVSQLYHQHL